METHHIPFLASSNPANGATNIAEDGGRFTVFLQRPMEIPKHAINCWVTVDLSTVWFNTPNIVDNENNEIAVYWNNSSDPPIGFTMEIPTGLYDLDHLNSEINRLLVGGGLEAGAIQLIPNTATGKVVLEVQEFYQVIFDGLTYPMNELLGFNLQNYPAGITGTIVTDPIEYFNAPNVAKFNSLEYYLIHSDISAGHGIRVNDEWLEVIQRVPINALPGSQIIYEPRNMQMIPSKNLIGREVNEINFWLTDDSNNIINTYGEYWSVSFQIHYVVPAKHAENHPYHRSKKQWK